MGLGTDPPRSPIRQTTRDFIASGVWNQTSGQLETTGGVAIKASLTQVAASGFGVTVEWVANVAADYGSAVTVIIPQATYNIVKNGAYSATTGYVTYSGINYTFQHIMSGSVRSMVAIAV